MTAEQKVITNAARRLREAENERTACEPVRDIIDETDIDSAYAVQQANISLGLTAGRRIAGRKVGLTAKAVQTQLGVDQPDFGVLFADTGVADDDDIELAALISPRVEAEVAFVMERDLKFEISTAADVLRATAFVVPAIEIVDSRVRDWDISIVDTIADNASAARFVLGTTAHRITEVDVRGVTMTMTSGESEVSTGRGAACLGNPVNAVVWLANVLAARGDYLMAGDIVLSGALGPMARVEQPGRYEAVIEGLGSVRVGFA